MDFSRGTGDAFQVFLRRRSAARIDTRACP
jgi:hypothetical protein